MPTVLKVLLPLPLPAFSYLPPHGGPLPEVGARVAVPWQAGMRLGIVSAHEEVRGGVLVELKEAIALLDETPWLRPEALKTVERVASYTFSPPGLVLSNLLATGLHEALQHEVRAFEDASRLAPEAWTPAHQLAPETLELLRRQGLIEERVSIVKPMRRVLVPLKPPDEALAGPRQRSQRAALECLWESGSAASAAELGRIAMVPEGAVRGLVRKGYVGYEEVAVPAPVPPEVEAAPDALQVPQAPARAGVQLVMGGSRLARVAALVRQIEGEVARGRSVLVLVPEGVFVGETARALGGAVAVRCLSGELSEAQRLRLWKYLQEEPAVLVGTYLALLAPLVKLGRIIVLEESSPSYKLNAGCRAFVPTAARFLAEAHGAALVLADAAPGAESAALAKDVFRLPRGPVRAHVVNLEGSGNWPLSADLIRVLKQVRERSRQAILLSPRRGFSALLYCPSCGWRGMCPNCALPLRYHAEVRGLRCHQCGHGQRAPSFCPSCHDHVVCPRGPGTQWIVQEVTRLLPSLAVYRYDRDRRDDLSPLTAGEPGVVVATTAIFRHPPLPHASLIALTLVDSFLGGGDFRGDETSYRLLLNLTELSRQKRPLVLLQTFQPEAAPLLAFCDPGRDGLAYGEELLERRRRFGYPPYRLLAQLQVSAKERAVAQRAATWLAGAVKARGGGDEEVLGPVPAPVERLRGRYCYQIVLKVSDHERLEGLVAPALNYRGAARVRVDVDPRDLLSLLD